MQTNGYAEPGDQPAPKKEPDIQPTHPAVGPHQHDRSDESQQWYAEANGEYPVRPGVPESDILKSWGDFKMDTLNLSRLGELNPDALRLMDRAGWK